MLDISFLNKKNGQQEWLALTYMEYAQHISILNF